MTTERTDPPLKGIKVLEIARVLAGPWAGQLLADLGADVIKLESPSGDDTRAWGPPFIENPDGSKDAAYFHSTNRGKKSVVLDLANEADRSQALELANTADVVIENFKVGGLAKFGLDYASLSATSPELVYCSITGFGQSGPDAHRPGYDFIIQGLSGVMDLTGDPNGEPQKMGVAFADIFTGLYAVIGIQAALRQRDLIGQGQHIDMALLDTMISVLANQNLNFLASGETPNRLGNAHPNISPYEVVPVEDGWFILAVGNNNQLASFCEVVALPDLTQDEKYCNNESRLMHRKELSALIASKTSTWKRDELLAALNNANVPVGPINTVAQAFAEPQVIHRELQLMLNRTSDGAQVPGVANPIRFSESQQVMTAPSPRLGEHIPKWDSPNGTRRLSS